MPLTDEGLTQDEWMRYAELWARLPSESLCVQRLNPDARWGEAEQLLRLIEFDIRHFSWMFSEDGEKHRNAPHPIKTPSEVKEAEAHAEAALAEKDEIKDAFGLDV